MTRLLVVGLLVVVVTLPSTADARSWRCGVRLVGTGQTIDEVYHLCGEPADRTFDTEYVTVRLSCGVRITRAVAVEEWLYNRGSKQFLRYLTFRDGILVDVEEGTYGY